jgi:WD40 repeat protein
MRMNRWLWTGRCLGIVVTLMITTLNALDAMAARDHAPGSASMSADPSMSAERPPTILPIGHSVGVDAVAFAPDGTLIASGNVDNLVRLWQTQTGKIWRTLTGHSSGVTSVAFSPDGVLVASGSWDGTVCLWQI